MPLYTVPNIPSPLSLASFQLQPLPAEPGADEPAEPVAERVAEPGGRGGADLGRRQGPAARRLHLVLQERSGRGGEGWVGSLAEGWCVGRSVWLNYCVIKSMCAPGFYEMF